MAARDIAIYAGTFDPITNGHIDIIKRALGVFSRLIVAVGENPSKKCLFSKEERVGMIKEAVKGMNVEVDSFTGLLVDYAERKGCRVIIRSLRAVSDFDYEFQMAVMNRQLDNGIESVFLMTDKEYFYLSSSLVKELATRNAGLSALVPGHVASKLMQKLAKTSPEKKES